jgi:hypothetical protein
MINAKVAQLVELQPSKLVVASSSLVFRSKTSNENLRFFFIQKLKKNELNSKTIKIHLGTTLNPA